MMQFIAWQQAQSIAVAPWANAVTRLVTPQPNCRFILPSYLACSRCRNICPDFSLHHLSESCPQFPARSYQCPVCQCPSRWIPAEITLLTLTGAEADLLLSCFFNVMELCDVNCSSSDTGTGTWSWEAMTKSIVKWHFEAVIAACTHTWQRFHALLVTEYPQFTIRKFLVWPCQILMPK